MQITEDIKATNFRTAGLQWVVTRTLLQSAETVDAIFLPRGTSQCMRIRK